MVEGRIKKFYEESVLLEQPIVMDGKTKISQIISNFEKDNNCKLVIKDFVRYEIGEGIKVEKTDFVSDVMSMTK